MSVHSPVSSEVEIPWDLIQLMCRTVTTRHGKTKNLKKMSRKYINNQTDFNVKPSI